MAKTISMKLSAEGLASMGMRAIRQLKEDIALHDCSETGNLEIEPEDVYPAEAAIRGLYDTVLALCQEKVTPAQMREFLFNGDDIQSLKFLGGVLQFTEGKDDDH